MNDLTAGDLRDNELFTGLTEAQLTWLAEVGIRRDLADGEVLFRDGEPAGAFYLLLDGQLIITKTVDGRRRILTRHILQRDAENAEPDPGGKPAAAHHFTGELPLLSGTPYVATASAVGPTVVAVYRKPHFLEMLERCPHVSTILLPVLAWRIHTSEVQAGQRATLEALATMAGGLAHELNNPASTIVRAADDLLDGLDELLVCTALWGRAGHPREQRLLAREVADVAAGAIGAAGGVTGGVTGDAAGDAAGGLGDGAEHGPLGEPPSIGDQVDGLVDWLDDQGVPAAERLGEELAEQGLDAGRLAGLAAHLRPEVLLPALDCFASALRARLLMTEIITAGRRITALVAASRAYTGLGQPPGRDIDVVEGIEAALIMLAPKLAEVTVRRGYQSGLPRVVGHPRELNQVWIHLIDNAADAMSGSGGGLLSIGTRREGDRVVVEFDDTGGGVPAELRSRMFQPFFTTKDVGSGTGLGLHLVHEIVERRHGGSIVVGSTTRGAQITVSLPIVS